MIIAAMMIACRASQEAEKEPDLVDVDRKESFNSADLKRYHTPLQGEKTGYFDSLDDDDESYDTARSSETDPVVKKRTSAQANRNEPSVTSKRQRTDNVNVIANLDSEIEEPVDVVVLSDHDEADKKTVEMVVSERKSKDESEPAAIVIEDVVEGPDAVGTKGTQKKQQPNVGTRYQEALKLKQEEERAKREEHYQKKMEKYGQNVRPKIEFFETGVNTGKDE